MPKTLLSLLFLKAGPQDLPASRSLLIISLLVYFLAGSLHQSISPGESRGPVSVLVSLLTSAILLSSLLYAVKKSTRFQQSFSALCLVSTAFTLLLFPLTFSIASIVESGSNIPVAYGFLYLFVLGWSLAVDGHILRHTLDIRPVYGILLASLFMMVQISVDSAIFGIPSE